MSKNAKSLKKYVGEQVKAGNTDEQALGIALMQDGYTMALVNRELSKQLVALGVKVDPNATMKAVRDFLAKNKKALQGIKTHEDLATYSGIVAKDNKADVAKVTKAVRKQMKTFEIDVPTKPKLGNVKSAIVDYFHSTKDHTVSGLADAITKNVPVSEGETAEQHAEKCKRHSYMNFTFARLLWEHEKIA